jgi:antitoxin MazE
MKKWGDSAAVRIPASVMRAARLELGEEVDVREETGRIVIEPVRRKNTTFESCSIELRQEIGTNALILAGWQAKRSGKAAVSVEELAEVRAKIVALIS